MGHELQSPPRTIMGVFKMLPEGTLAEINEGTLYMSPANPILFLLQPKKWTSPDPMRPWRTTIVN